MIIFLNCNKPLFVLHDPWQYFACVCGPFTEMGRIINHCQDGQYSGGLVIPPSPAMGRNTN